MCFADIDLAAGVPPEVDLTGTNNGRPVTYDTDVILQCVATAGIPQPDLEVRPSTGFQLPSGTTTTRRGNMVEVTLNNLREDVCFDCIGLNSVGRDVDVLCLDVLGKWLAVRCLDTFQSFQVQSQGLGAATITRMALANERLCHDCRSTE